MASNIIKAGAVNIFRFRDRFWREFRGGSLDIHNIIIALFEKKGSTQNYGISNVRFNEAKINEFRLLNLDVTT